MPTPLPFATNFPFYFGGGGPGAGYYSDLFRSYQNDLANSWAGVGLPALAESASSPGYAPTPFARGGPGQQAAQGAFSQLAGGLNQAQGNKRATQSNIAQKDIQGAGQTAAGYSDALSQAIANAIEADRINQEQQLQTIGLFGGLLQGGLGLGKSLFGEPGSSGYIGKYGTAGLLGPFGGLFSSAKSTP